jgi:hypothetical protein
MNRSAFLKSVQETAKRGQIYFVGAAKKRTLDEWNQRKLKDSKKGSVYVYFDANLNALYVGETGGGIKARSNFITSKHRNATWWKRWKHIYFLPCSDRTDRLTLELLLILSYQPKGNTKPGPRLIKKMFPSSHKK